MNEKPVDPARVKDLLVQRRNCLMLLLPWRKEIEAASQGETVQLPENVMRMLCTFIAGDLIVFVDGNIRDTPRPPAGEVEVSDDKRQQFAIEVYCPLNTRGPLEDLLDAAVQRVVAEYGFEGHFNKVHRVAAVIEYNPAPEEKPTDG